MGRRIGCWFDVMFERLSSAIVVAAQVLRDEYTPAILFYKANLAGGVDIYPATKTEIKKKWPSSASLRAVEVPRLRNEAHL